MSRIPRGVRTYSAFKQREKHWRWEQYLRRTIDKLLKQGLSTKEVASRMDMTERQIVNRIEKTKANRDLGFEV